MKRFLAIIVFVGVFGGIYYYSVSRTSSVTSKHAYDSMVQQKTSPAFRALNKNRILQDPNLSQSLNLSEEQKAQFRKLYEPYAETRKSIYESWRKENPDAGYYLPYSAEEEEEYEVQTSKQAVSLLTQSQVGELQRVEYRLVGWDFIFFDDVRRQLNMSESQIAAFKDMQFGLLQETLEINRRWRAADSQLRPKLETQLLELRKAYDDRRLGELSDFQKRKRLELIGDQSTR